jgi:hypothetical protein
MGAACAQMTVDLRRDYRGEMQLPYLDVYAPRYCQAEIDLLKTTCNCGILEAIGLGEMVDGTFDAIRVTFSDDRGKRQYAARCAVPQRLAVDPAL